MVVQLSDLATSGFFFLSLSRAKKVAHFLCFKPAIKALYIEVKLLTVNRHNMGDIQLLMYTKLYVTRASWKYSTTFRSIMTKTLYFSKVFDAERE